MTSVFSRVLTTNNVDTSGIGSGLGKCTQTVVLVGVLRFGVAIGYYYVCDVVV